MRSHVTLLQGKVMSCSEYKPPYRATHYTTKYKDPSPSVLSPSPERGVDLQGFAQHLGSDVVHVVPAQVHFSQAGVAPQGVDQNGSPRAQARLGQRQGLQDLQRGETRVEEEEACWCVSEGWKEKGAESV